ncbi:MAG: cysteine desulfurase NifS [Candidatus Aenigmatarchaeota archaeon]
MAASKIYMDYAATTPVRPEVLKAMMPYFDRTFGNASSIHRWGREAKEALDSARATVAKALGCKESEIVFTSGGTEADNLAIIGAALANREKGKHIITSAVEHHAVLDACKWLEKEGFAVTYLPVDEYGMVSPADVEKAIRKDTILATVMHANNEIGTINPIAEIGEVCRARGVLFHTDAVQTFCHIPIDLANIDMLSVSSHKVGGPKGVGALFVRSSVTISPIIHGGGQERGLRSGTENVAGIVGFAKAAEMGMKEMAQESKRLAALRDRLIAGTLKIPDSALTGHPTARLPNHASFWFKFIEGEALGLALDAEGIASSTGSACSSKSLEPSHVLLACGLKAHEAHGSLRLTIGKATTRADVDYVLRTLPRAVAKLREISPFKTKYE